MLDLIHVVGISSFEEVNNYFIDRQQDAERNSINLLAQQYYTQKQLDGINIKRLQDKLFREQESIGMIYQLNRREVMFIYRGAILNLTSIIDSHQYSQRTLNS